MSDKYYILRVEHRVEHLQKVCYVILGDVPGFKALKIIDEIRSYFEKNNIDISTFLFYVGFHPYHLWLELATLEHVIKLNSSDEVQLPVTKYRASSIKYELEIEPTATIRTYACDTPEIIFNEWFGVDKSDKQKEKRTVEMNSESVDCEKESSCYLHAIEQRIDDILQSSGIERSSVPGVFFAHAIVTGDTKPLEDFIADHHFTNSTEKNEETSYNPVSSALSKIRIRVNKLERLKNSRSAIECNMITHQKAIDKLTYQLNEINEDIIHTQNRINTLRKEAVAEGYEEWFIDRIIKEEMGHKE